jgi:hypothetical protein
LKASFPGHNVKVTADDPALQIHPVSTVDWTAFWLLYLDFALAIPTITM